MEITKQINQKIESDPAFAAALKAAKTAQEALKVIRDAGFQLTEEAFAEMKEANGAALSDEALDKVSGGWWIFWQMTSAEEE